MKKKYFIYIITLFWIVVIFSFSLQPASQSSQISDSVGQLIIGHSSSQFMEEVEQWSALDRRLFHTIIRKCAHFAEFLILGVLMIRSMHQTTLIHKKILAFCGSGVVAMMDELIQRFVPGRAGMIIDVLLDCVGAGVGIVIGVFIIRKEIQK